MSSATKRNLIIAVACLVVSGAIFGYMLASSERQRSELEGQLVALEKQRIQETSYLQMRRTVEEAESDIKALDNMFLERESDSIDFLNAVEASAAGNNVSLETEALSAEGSDDERYLVVRYSITGTEVNVRNFITVLEQSQYLAEITTLNLNERTAGGWQAEVTVRVNLFTYAE